MKICIITNGDAYDKKTWSGTPYNLVTRLEKYEDISVVTLNLTTIIKHPFYNLLKKTFGKIFYIKGSTRDPLVFKSDAKKIQKILDNIAADINIFAPEYCLCRRKENTLYYTYVDTTERPLLEADNKKKLGIQMFLKQYEKNEIACYDLLDGAFTQNEWSKESISKLYKQDKSKLYNVGFGINTDFFNGEKDYNDNHLLIILRKGTEHLKGLDLLLEAFKIAKTRIPNLKLSVVGTDYTKIDGVTYYYNEPRSKTVELLQKSTLYVMPAIREPNGITYLEALANKTPIVGLDRFAFSEFCGYGEYGFISKDDTVEGLAETIETALSDKEKLKIMAEKGQEYVKQRFNWDTVIEKMVTEFRNKI